jgi:hypothetical protein
MLSLSCDPSALAVLGVGGVLLGMAELGLCCVRRFATWKVSVALVAALALAGGAAYACGEGALLGQPALVLAGVALTLLLFRSRNSIAGRPVVQGAGLALLSGALLGWGMYRLDQKLESELFQSDVELAQMSDPIDENTPPALLVSSDAGRSIPLFNASPSAPTVSPEGEARFLRDLRLDTKVIRTAPPDLKYNCHGFVFTDGRYWVRSAMVATILKDNDYEAVTQPRAGDVAVFRNQLGEVTHTGLVRAGGKDGGILIESKWGRYGRYVHGPEEHGYRGHELTYYRSSRGGHLLKGLESPAATPASPAAASPAAAAGG